MRESLYLARACVAVAALLILPMLTYTLWAAIFDVGGCMMLNATTRTIWWMSSRLAFAAAAWFLVTAAWLGRFPEGKFPDEVSGLWRQKARSLTLTLFVVVPLTIVLLYYYDSELLRLAGGRFLVGAYGYKEAWFGPFALAHFHMLPIAVVGLWTCWLLTPRE